MRPEVTGQKISELALEERFGVSVKLAAQYAGISRSSIYELLASGDLAGRVIAGRRIVEVASLLKLCGEAPRAKRQREKETARSEGASP
jgi:hypothetical protein